MENPFNGSIAGVVSRCFCHGFLLVKNTWKTNYILPNFPAVNKDNFLKEEYRIQKTGDRIQEPFVIGDLRMAIDDFFVSICVYLTYVIFLASFASGCRFITE